MKLFLTSNAFLVLDEFVKLLNLHPEQLTVAFIPTAADIYENKHFIYDDRDKLVELGFKVKELNIANKTREYLQEELAKFDIIFVAGGNSFYLLEQARRSGFDKVIERLVKQGKYYIGSSAGAVIVGSSIEHVQLLDDPKVAPELDSFNGIGLINKMLLPHYDNARYEDRMREISDQYGDIKDKLITLKDNEGLLVEDDKLKIIHS